MASGDIARLRGRLQAILGRYGGLVDVDDGSAEAVLSTWTIYSDPVDYPGKFVVRRFEVRWGFADAVPVELVAVVDTLDEARDAMPDGLWRIHRDVNDDPVIVETWL